MHVQAPICLPPYVLLYCTLLGLPFTPVVPNRRLFQLHVWELRLKLIYHATLEGPS